MELSTFLKAIEAKAMAMETEMLILKQALQVTVADLEAASDKARERLDWDDAASVQVDRAATDDHCAAMRVRGIVGQISTTLCSSVREISLERSEYDKRHASVKSVEIA